MKNDELIDYYSYYYCDSENFVKEHLNNYKEMDFILKSVFKNIIENMKKEYTVMLGENKIMFENKKTKETYSMSIEF